MESKDFQGFSGFFRDFKSKTYNAFQTLYDFLKLCLNLFDQLCMNFARENVKSRIEFWTSPDLKNKQIWTSPDLKNKEIWTSPDLPK